MVHVFILDLITNVALRTQDSTVVSNVLGGCDV